MRAGANVLWFIFGGGWLAAILWVVVAGIMYISVIGIPWGRSAIEIAKLSAFPFGKEVVKVADLQGEDLTKTSALRGAGNFLWLPFGIFLATAHLLAAVIYCITVIGIPFGIQYFKLAGLAIAPVGKRIVSNELAKLVADDKAKRQFEQHRRVTQTQ